MVIWYQEVTFQLICTSNTVEITCFISFIWIINRWASEELGCELQFLKPGFNYHWCMCFMLMFYSTDCFRTYLSIRKSQYLGQNLLSLTLNEKWYIVKKNVYALFHVTDIKAEKVWLRMKSQNCFFCFCVTHD